MPNFRTKDQNRIMFGLASQAGIPHEDLQEMAYEVSGWRTSHTSELFIDECDQLINYLKSLLPSDTPRRTVQYRRQKAGVVQVETHKQWKEILRRWRKYKFRTDTGLETICLRTIKKTKPETTIEANKIFEAVKRMNKAQAEKDKNPPPTPGAAKKAA